jgi:thiosulfate reductase cytochrome b subunit
MTHPYLARLSHWLFAISVLVLGASGLQILRAFPGFTAKLPEPAFSIPVPQKIALGGWLGGALDWHLTFAWFFAFALLLYAIDLASGGWRRLWLSMQELRGIVPMARYYFMRGPMPEITALYNPFQKSAYLVVTIALIAALITGAMMALPVQFSTVLRRAASWQTVRVLHFACLCVFAGFLPGHLVMVALAGRTAMAQMLIGGSNNTRRSEPR